ncbi:plastocyanin [Halogranum amylolyticum]|uniref:Plastocyanin n=1 Tax=Halogranum amylolyticum TaxID=660520 RepID=A0A1H8PET0_9EURY|nr:plastocyanin/azurin family copper-binding protein [Halogranum amylolyticum]SEO40472.1 plastocyanin [Halogranum amylolyticum]
MTDGNADLSRRAFLTAAGTAVAAAGTAAAQQEGNGTATGNETTTASGDNATTTAAGNESSGNASAGNETAGNESSGNESSGNESGGGGGGGGMSKTVTVGPEGELVFDPAEVEVTPGSTITWVWESDNHNVVPSSVPEGASWKGSEGGDSKTYDTGHEYSYTFETEGTYEYYCSPHESAGMTGTISVTPDAGGGGGGGGGGGSSVPTVPDSAKSLGVATSFSMVATLGLAYFFMKYGGDYGTEQ